MKILHNDSTLAHRTSELVGGRLIDAYESPTRITSILTALATYNYAVTTVPTSLAEAEDAAAKIHTPEYLQHLRTIFDTWRAEEMVAPDGCVLPECFPVNRFAGKGVKEPKDISARVGYYAFDMSTGISAATYESAIASADLARRGAEQLVEHPGRAVFSLCRPPGHHCSTDLMGGYCYLNNTAIAVRTLLDRISSNPTTTVAEQQISILDLDFHHGNGTQSIFYADRNPCYISIHGEDEYPYFTGAPCETGKGAGDGYNLNLPIPCGQATWELYHLRLLEAVDKIRAVDTRWLVVSLGFDTFVGDPVGKFALERRDYGAIGEIVGAMALPTLVVLEGGYVIKELGNNCVEFLKGLERGREKAWMVNSVVNGGEEQQR